jgi:hypothetical protein
MGWRMSAAAACACALVVAALAVPGHAQAAADDVVKAKDTASAQWPASPCRGREKVIWVPQVVLDADHVVRGFAADALVGACAVRVTETARRWSGARLCALLQHEFGHLAGRMHTDDQQDIMFSGTLPWTRACTEAFPPPRALSARWKCRVVPAAGRTFRWDCRPRPRQRSRPRARRR